MTDYVARGYAQLPESPRFSGFFSALKNFLNSLLGVLDSVHRACLATAKYQQLTLTSDVSESGAIARQVYEEYFGDQ